MKKKLLLPTLLLLLSLSLFGQPHAKKELLFVAHRGASYLAPENTLASIELAWELGAPAAECDVMLSSDNQVVVFHDKNTGKLTGENHEVATTSWEVLKELKIKLRDTNRPGYEGAGIPLLSEVLASVPQDRMLVIEIKTGPEILPFLKLVVDRHLTRGKIAFISFDFDAVRQAKAIYPEVPCYYLAMFKKDARKHIDRAVESGLDGLNLRHAIIDKKMAGRCKDAGLDLWCWTVNDPETAFRMKQLGVSAITTDRPAWLREQLYP